MASFSANNHHYSFGEAGLTYRDPYGRDFFFPFKSRLRLHNSWSGKLYLKGKDGKVPLWPLPTAEQKALVLDLFRRWKAIQPEGAKKAAFDYLDAQRGFVLVAFLTTLLFCLPLAIAMLADARNSFRCSHLMQTDGVLGEMQVTKQKKKRKGHYILQLTFNAPNGETIKGSDQFITPGEELIPKTVPILYSTSRPSCWSLTKNPTSSEVDWVKRKVLALFVLFFGVFFALVSALGFAWSWSRWRTKRPFQQEIRDLFHLNIAVK